MTYHLLSQKLTTINLTEQIEVIRLAADKAIDQAKRTQLGQFLTPAPIARLMASMFKCETSDIFLLDAGAGIGMLLGATVEMLCQRTQRPRSIHITAYEIDPILIPYLKETLLLCEEYCSQGGILFTSTVIADDFISHSVEQLTEPLFSQQRIPYTCAILNPPYRKIQTNSHHRQLLRRVEVETSNLYTGFLALSTQLLANNGELVSITPRSFCNGLYFRPFREFFLEQMSLRQFHLFNSRTEAFIDNDVLQENIILSAIKSKAPSKNIIITSTTGPDDDMPSIRSVSYEQVVYSNDPERFIHIIPDQLGGQFAAQIAALSTRLNNLGLTVSTGRVVDFRAAEFLRDMPEGNTAPLIYPTHLLGGQVVWPKATSKKPNALVQCEATNELLIPNGYYVLVKRFSSKEERRRVVATLYTPGSTGSTVIGFENHLNYFHNNGQGLDPLLARGLAVFLNSTLVDSYFRQFNGHTQVNATDLRNIPYPSSMQLVAIGERSGTDPLSQEEIDTLIREEIAEMSIASDSDPSLTKKRIDEALALIRELGFPRAQQNERSALTLLALVGLTPTIPWSEARAPLCGITPMMDFFAEHYGKQYKPNTRETVRRQTVHQFLEAGIIIANPDDPARPINSPKAVYQIEASALELLQTYGSDEWDVNLRTYLASVNTLKQRYAQERELQRIPVTLPSGISIRLSPGGQNILIKQIIDEFAARFTPGGEVIYIGDTDEKFAFFAEERLQELGIIIDSHGKMPDVVIYYTERQWLVLIEAVTSHGPIDPKRRGELAYLFRSTTVGMVYVTAFLTRQAMKEYLPMISWSTEVWVADAPDHLIHFNGDRFLGPYTQPDHSE